MRLSLSILLLAIGADAFAPVCRQSSRLNVPCTILSEAATAEKMADSGKPPASSGPDANIEDVEIPTNLPSDVGMDYIPLATMLATGQLAEADQVRWRTRRKEKTDVPTKNERTSHAHS